MIYSVRVNEVKQKDGSNVRGFASIVFDNSFKITNVAILENKETKELFISMPRYKVGSGSSAEYRDICNPITAEFRDELYQNILEGFHKAVAAGKMQEIIQEKKNELQFNVRVRPYDKDGSNLKGSVRIYLGDGFLVNNVSILQGKKNLFISMPSYRTNETDPQGKAVYQDVCYPVTKEFREKLYGEIMSEYEKVRIEGHSKQKTQEPMNYDQSDKNHPRFR